MKQSSLFPLGETKKQANRTLLLKSIAKKRVQLRKAIIATESLKVQLDLLKQEYMVKVGLLVAKDNQLDLEIIQLRNLLSLIRDGKSKKEAEESVRSMFYSEELELEREQEQIRYAEQVLKNREESSKHSSPEDLKKLWIQLISKFHPDLTQDIGEKKNREEIMKKINIAYEEQDYERLKKIESEHEVLDATPNEKLEEILAELENSLIEQKKEVARLKASEWYSWYRKSKRTKQSLANLFKEVEKNLLRDIVNKLDLLKSLRVEVNAVQR